jgi:hypothetical protein
MEKNNGSLWICEIQIWKHPHEFLSDGSDWITSWRKGTLFFCKNAIGVDEVPTNCG